MASNVAVGGKHGLFGTGCKEEVWALELEEEDEGKEE